MGVEVVREFRCSWLLANCETNRLAIRVFWQSMVRQRIVGEQMEKERKFRKIEKKLEEAVDG